MSIRVAVALSVPLAIALSGCAGTVTPVAKPTPTHTVTHTPTPTPTPTPTYNLDDPAAVTVIVNKHRPLATVDYEPTDLVIPTSITNVNGFALRAEASAALDQLSQAALSQGVALSISSAYRSYLGQQNTYNEYLGILGEAGADLRAARPGYSEHQLGLAVDLDDGNGCLVNVCFAGTPGGIWLAANAWQYGFVLRYPDGYAGTTGYEFEPWHYRYVGIEVATAMHNKGIATLEEFFGLEPAPSY
ncbi:M15 family metallopeptidase [Aurantimicrobium minutum]|uniref:M15 family metallopeptidase n=1 Tax=Aurantimicrobium minutum TaxID=708131 RepID=UPI00247437D5|nr:M15 family metallopeptidase [Aurantimicrobium minutum]MDH6423390.1 D-alanyl-D-alanine carboxypeptidase [Aurantimicrobium minutum]